MLKTEQTREDQTIQTRSEEQTMQTGAFHSCEGIAESESADEENQSANEMRSILDDFRITQRMGLPLSDKSRMMLNLIYDNLSEDEIQERELRIHNDPIDNVDWDSSPAGYDLSPASTPWTAAEPHPLADVLEMVGMTVYEIVEYIDVEAEQQCLCIEWDEFAPPCAGCIALNGNYPETVIEPASLGLSLPDRIAAMHDFDISLIDGTAEVDLLMVELGLR